MGLSLNKHDPLAQLVEHMTFNHGVPSSTLGWVTNMRVGSVMVARLSPKQKVRVRVFTFLPKPRWAYAWVHPLDIRGAL